MVREGLKKFHGQTLQFRAVFSHYGTTTKGHPTMLLIWVRRNRQMVADHLWVKINQNLLNRGFKGGEILAFTARVDTYYKKGDDTLDYNLVEIEGIHVIPNRKKTT